jgi:hypothetical protein
LSRRRQRELRRIQRRLEGYYGLERAPSVTRFVRDGDLGSREVVLVRQSNDELQIALVLPPESKQVPEGGTLSDAWLQVAEGVSHFLYLAERARVHLPVTQLELELQAEVDKFLLSLEFSTDSARRLLDRMFDRPRFLDDAGTEAGDRYRLAHQLAARFVSRVLVANDRSRAQQQLRSFYRAGQTEKIHLARVA